MSSSHCLILNLSHPWNKKRMLPPLALLFLILACIKAILENSITQSDIALFVVKWDTNGDVLWFLECYFEKRTRCMIIKTSFTRENLCAVAIQNFDVATVESKIRHNLFLTLKSKRLARSMDELRLTRTVFFSFLWVIGRIIVGPVNALLGK